MENSVNRKSKVRVIALDFDGVVTNLDIDWDSAIHLASAIAGYEVKSLLTFYETSYGTVIFQKVSREMEKLEQAALAHAELTPFVAEFLQRLSQCGTETYIVSSQSAQVIEEFLRKHGLACYFREILGRERFPNKKAQVEYVLDKSKASSDEVLLVDDSQRNITKCKDLGIRYFYFTRRQDADRTKQMWNAIIAMVQGRTL
jgi:HAD superfamily hydrolase (TIGR01509 family)